MLTTRTLPRCKRPGRSFDDVFGVTADAVLSSMDAAQDDVVQQAPRRRLALSDVGCRRGDIVVQIADPFGSGDEVSAVCGVEIGTMVPPDRRGVHMSRMGDALATLVQEPHRDLTTFAAALADTIDRREYGGPTRVTLDARVPYLEELPCERRPSTSTKTSLEHLALRVTVRTGPGARTDVGLRVTHIVACPCVQQTGRHVRLARGLPAHDEGALGVTHSQRCDTTVTVCRLRGAFPVPVVLAALDGVLCRTTNTLPRGQELLLVVRAHERPQFVEDAVREAAWAVWRALDDQVAFEAIEADSRSLESIHDFDISAHATVTRETARLLDDEPDAPAD